MADAAVEKNDAAPEEVTSTETPKESPVKKSPAKKAAEPAESNGKKEENGSGDAPEEDKEEEDEEEAPTENGDRDEDSSDAVENGEAPEEIKEAGVKRKSVSTADNGDAAEPPAPEKKAKVAEEVAPAEEEAAA